VGGHKPKAVRGEHHLDETGFRIAGSLLHTTSSQSHTFYRVGEARGEIPWG
jgi:hypothetical protein